MNNTFISLIRFGLVAGAIFFASIGDVFAAPTITPASAETVSKTSAVLSAKVIVPQFQRATAWFEYGDTQFMSGATPANTISEGGNGISYGYVNNLRECTTYYFRAVVTEGGVTVSSQTSSLTTKGCVTVANTTTIVNNTQVVDKTPAPAVKKAPVKETVAVTKVATPVVNSVNTASVIGANSVLPGTLIGWVSLLISVLIALLIVAMIMEAGENRKKQLATAPISEDEEDDDSK